MKDSGSTSYWWMLLLLLTPVAFWVAVYAPTSSKSPVSACDLSLARYEQIRSRMSYSEVRYVLGCDGVEMSRVEIPNTPTTVMYMWQGAGPGNMTAMFQDRLLVSKAQFGLR